MAMMSNLRAMAIFVAVVDCGSFGKAAKQFNISTSAVSQQIKAFEQELGVSLLYRSTRTLSLTKTGFLVYDSAKAMVDEAQKIYTTLETLQNKYAKTITLSAPSNAIYYHSTLALKSALNKQLDEQLDKQNVILCLDSDDSDIALYLSTKTVANDTATHNIALISVPQWLLVSPTYTAIKTIDELQNATFIGQTKAIDFADGQTITPNLGFETKDSHLALMLACDGLGVVKSHYLDAHHWIATKQLKPLPFELPKITLYATIKTSSKTHKQLNEHWLEQYLMALKNYFSQLTFGV